MVTIEIGNGYSKICGLKSDLHAKLKEELSYIVGGKSAHFSKFGPRKASLLTKDGLFPTGLLGRVLATVKDAKIQDNRLKPRNMPGMFNIKL